MAGPEGISRSSSIKTTSYETALCVIPPQDQCQHIDNLRSLYDKGYNKWPPHISLVYPFVAPEHLPRAKEIIEAALVSSSNQDSLEISLDKAGCFKHKTNYTVWLGESEESADVLKFLRSTTLKALGQHPTPCKFHLTVGQSEDASESSREFLFSKARFVPDVQFPIEQIAILVREKRPGSDHSASQMRLWRTIDLSTELRTIQSPLSEFWIEQAGGTVDFDSDGEMQDSNEAAAIPNFNRQVQPGKTYGFKSASGSWEKVKKSELAVQIPEALTVSSYNVLIDSEYPPARDRDPHVRDAILSQAAQADILVLQEVSDDFLSYLLADTEVRSQYPFTSHGPPEQADIGPLPSLRNIVILSKWGFDWEFVPFHRRHKGAVVAKFNLLGSLPLVVAGVHLTCGLTDGSVAAKKVQVQNLKNHLSRHYPSNTWIVAGDFNIPTSTYTIDTALKNKSISQQTVKTLASTESSMSEAGLLDAWSIARVEAADRSANFDGDDLFDGEEGATFNPRENELAAATSGTSRNRPQRYDRILVRPQGALGVTRFNQFGRATTFNGAEQVPSDHWGIRAVMRVTDASADTSSRGVAALEQYSFTPKLASGRLADIDTLAETLEAHEMFPSDEEVQARKVAFSLVQEVLLGSSDESAPSTSDIPLVITTVGSYALNVWTSASDIDCLCVGSISSKTFFKLARQRLLRAESRGIRLLRKVEAQSGTMFEIAVNGVSMDLQYCPAARVAERWKELPTLQSSDPIFNLPVLSLRKLKPYRDIAYIQRTLPSLPVFRHAYRCIKLWAVQRGIYSSRFGYLSGIHITLMLTIVYKRLAHTTGSVNAADLVTFFFHYFAHFDWQNQMLFDPFFHKQVPRYHRSTREPMVILGYHAPNANVAHTSTVPGLNTLDKELNAADQSLSAEGMTWEQFFGSPISAAATGISSGMADFLRSHDSYVKIDIQYWGRTLGKGKGLVGWVESRCLLLVVDINKALPHLDVRIWPARFAKRESETNESDYNGCYLIGLSKNTSDSTSISKDDKAAARVALNKSFERFQTQLQADDKYYDPSDCWIGISLAKSSEVENLTLDTREWGEYFADFDIDSDDEEDEAEELDDTEALPAPRKLPLRRAGSPTTSAPVSSAKLRPASDILNRLRWDPALDPSDYIVGYEDRFLGAKETSLERWKTEQTDDEFIPQHRILYFKRRGDDVVVWERKSRIDLVFGSGASSEKKLE